MTTISISSPAHTKPLPVRIVDLDDESISRHGQWPWPRILLARLLERLTEAGTGVGVRREDRALADMFSVAIDAAIKDGTLSRLAIQWFGFDLAPKE